MKPHSIKIACIAIISLCTFYSSLNAQVDIAGELKQYHKTTLTFDALFAREFELQYLDFRLNVTITTPSGANYIVPGYFAADGNAAQTSTGIGDKWRCHFTPKEVGTYNYTVSFRTGINIAVSLDPAAGSPITVDGISGSFTINPTDKTGNDFRAKGKLQYTGKSAAQFDNGDYYFEIGADSPETFLEYADFDNTAARHDYLEVANNYTIGNPSWGAGNGTEIIGAVNYLANQGINMQYLIVNNISGDGNRAYPFRNRTNPASYDVSKLDQWQIVFDHMYNKGIAIEMVLSETENSNWFENEEGIPITEFSNSRKLFYREMIARFGYLNVFYNIGEEANWDSGGDQFTAAQIEEAAIYIETLSPYNDLITVHNGPSNDFTLFPQLTALPGTSALTAISMQGNFMDSTHGHDEIRNIKNLGNADGKEWVTRYTEPFSTYLPGTNSWTENSLWPSITAGASGIHYYSYDGDVDGDDFTLYASYYERMRYAKEFIEDNNLPFWDMSNNNSLINTGYLLTDNTDNYIVFLANGGTATIDLPGNDIFNVKWFDPRRGGNLQNGTVTSITSGTAIPLGEAPDSTNSSWVILIQKEGSANVPVTGITVTPENSEILTGETIQLTETVSPANATDKSVIWASSNPSIASVDNTGLVTAIAQGTATITATTNDGSFIDTATIIVNPSIIPVTAITVTPENAEVFTSQTQQLTAAINPSSATDKSITWTSSNNAIATVDSNGLVTALAVGTATITATTNDGGFTDTSIITVSEEVIPVVAISVTPQNSEVIIGQTAQLTATVSPANATDKSIIWTSSNNAIATVDSNGLVTAIAVGNVTITATTTDGGFTDAAIINSVEEVFPVTGISVTPQNSEVFIGQIVQLTATVSPANATDALVNWTSSNNAIATVDSNGLVTTLALGSVTITVTTNDGGFTDTAIITIAEEVFPVTGISVSPQTSQVFIGQTAQLTATVSPANATDKSVTWESSNNTIATVDSNGLVTAWSEGVVNISATTNDGGFIDIATISVPMQTISVTGISLTPNNSELFIGQTAQLTATVNPTNATDNSITWSSSNNAIATVDSNGLVLAIAIGTATITATTNDGGFTETAIITITEEVIPVTGIIVTPESSELFIGQTAQLAATVNPTNATDKSITWSSSNNAIATVDSNGLVSAIAIGTATITATTNDGGFTDNAIITVSEDLSNIAVTGITVTPGISEIFIGQTIQLTETVNPTNAANKTVTWSSSNTAIATVDSNGLVFGIATGNVTITATTNDGGFTDTTTITVSEDIIDECDTDYEERNNRVVIEAERLNTGGTWRVTTTDSGYSGDGYLEWGNGNNFSSPGNGLISVKIRIHDPGTYLFQWRTRIGRGTSPTDENDSWVRFPDASDNFATKDGVDGAKIYPLGSGKSPNPDGAGSDSWWKVYTNTMGWNWQTRTSDNDPHDIYAQFDTPGIYTLEISARSEFHLIDRIVLSKQTNDATDLSHDETKCTGTNETIAVTGVTVSPKTSQIFVGQTAQLTATVNPSNATDKTVTWSSSDTAIATVDSNGLVTAIATGEVIITVTTNDGSFTDTTAITVNEDNSNIPVTEVSVTPEELDIFIGQTAQLSATVSPANATNKTVIWTSSDTAIATVDSNGLVLALALGTVTIIATTVDGTFTNTAIINVVDEYIGVTGVVLLPEESDILVSETKQLTVTVAPANATDKSIIWISSDGSIATIDENGLVTGVAIGTVTITAKTTDGDFTDTAIINVLDVDPPPNTPVTGIEVTPETFEIFIAETLQLTAIINPANATDTSVIWTSSDENIATVDENGLVTAIALGTVTITAKTVDGEFTDTATVNVIKDDSEEPIPERTDFKIHPNPTDSTKILYVSGLNEDYYTIILFDMTGKLVNTKGIEFRNRMGEVDISALEPGMYYIKVGDNKSVFSAKFIVR